MAEENESSPRYIRVAQVLIRYGGVSQMWLTRRLRDDGFPAPCYFGSSERFFRVDELDGWDRAMIARAVEAPKVKPVPPPSPKRKAVQS